MNLVVASTSAKQRMSLFLNVAKQVDELSFFTCGFLLDQKATLLTLGLLQKTALRCLLCN